MQCMLGGKATITATRIRTWEGHAHHGQVHLWGCFSKRSSLAQVLHLENTDQIP